MEKSKIKGQSIIDHAKRISIGLTMEEYAVADLFERAKINFKKVDNEVAFIKLGLTPEEFQKIKDMLHQKQMIETPTSHKLTNKWYQFEQQFEKDFEGFWFKDNRCAWSGSKTQAQKLYVNLRKSVDKDYLIKCRDDYFAYLAVNPWRHKMMATVFLNPTTKRYEENWSELVQVEKETIPVKKKAPIHIDVAKLLEQ
jgi:hypothetical protein